MKSKLLYWVRFGAVATASAAVTATLLNLGTAFAVDNPADSIKPAMTAYAIPTESAAAVGLASDRKPDPEEQVDRDSSTVNVPTSMLWPTDRFIPQQEARLG